MLSGDKGGGGDGDGGDGGGGDGGAGGGTSHVDNTFHSERQRCIIVVGVVSVL